MEQMTAMAVPALALALIGAAMFALGALAGSRRRSRTTVTWRDLEGRPIRQTTFYGERERCPWAAELPWDFYQDGYVNPDLDKHIERSEEYARKVMRMRGGE